MSNDKRVVRGGFRSTAALLIAIIALILSLMALNRTGGQVDLKAQINELQGRIEKMKKETAEKVNKVRQETSKALEKIGIDVEKE
jgi:TolA-binding protein